MTLYIYTNCLGSFVFDEKVKIVDSIIFKDDIIENYNKIKKGIQTDAEIKLLNKHSAKVPDENFTEKIRLFFSDITYFDEFYKNNLEICKANMQHAFTYDHLLIQAIKTITEMDKINNTLVKRLREWYEIYYPEFSHKFHDNEAFARKVPSEKKIKSSFGTDLEKKDLDQIISLANKINELVKERNDIKKYIEKTMRDYCPNLLEVAGPTIGANLITLAGSLKRLATLPYTVIQLLGAEKALFKHITTKSKSPKYGIIVNHPVIQGTKLKGKAARAVASKLSLACKLDYFKGEFQGKELRKILDKRFK